MKKQASVGVKVEAKVEKTARSEWTCRLCLRRFRLPVDFIGEERFQSVCADCVVASINGMAHIDGDGV